MKRRHVKSEARKEDILAAALPLAERYGYDRISREQITTAAGVTGPVLNYHFGTMLQFRRDLMRYAVKSENLAVVAQGIAAKDPKALKAPKDLRHRAIFSLLR